VAGAAAAADGEVGDVERMKDEDEDGCTWFPVRHISDIDVGPPPSHVRATASAFGGALRSPGHATSEKCDKALAVSQLVRIALRSRSAPVPLPPDARAYMTSIFSAAAVAAAATAGLGRRLAAM